MSDYNIQSFINNAKCPNLLRLERHYLGCSFSYTQGTDI